MDKQKMLQYNLCFFKYVQGKQTAFKLTFNAYYINCIKNPKYISLKILEGTLNPILLSFLKYHLNLGSTCVWLMLKTIIP